MTAELRSLSEFCQCLLRVEAKYVIGGSFASSAWGKPRQTNDFDIAVLITEQQANALADILPRHFLLDRRSLLGALRSAETYRMAQVLDETAFARFDLFLLQESEYVLESLARAQDLSLGEGASLCIASAEDIVIAKLRWFELGNRVSDRQWNDICQVLEVQKGNLDEEFLNHWATHFGVRELLDEARSQTLD
jgi:hypothetical protein